MTSRFRLRHLLLALPILVVGFAVATTSQKASPPETSVISNTETAPVGTSAMKAYIDPETGVLSVSSSNQTAMELDEATKQSLRRDDEGLIQVTHPDGSVSIDLQGRFSSAATIRLTDEGKVMSCSSDEGAVCNALHDHNHTPAQKKLEVQ